MFATITFSTWLTLSRIAFSPCIMFAIYLRFWGFATIMFMIAASTDFFDGYYARLYQEETKLGKILDPVADKVLLFSTLTSLFTVSDQSLIPVWFVYLFVGKDLLLLAGAYVLLHYKKSCVINPSKLSKLTTALCMLFFIYCLFMHAGYVAHHDVAIIIQGFALSMIGIVLDYGYTFYIRLKE